MILSPALSTSFFMSVSYSGNLHDISNTLMCSTKRICVSYKSFWWSDDSFSAIRWSATPKRQCRIPRRLTAPVLRGFCTLVCVWHFRQGPESSWHEVCVQLWQAHYPVIAQGIGGRLRTSQAEGTLHHKSKLLCVCLNQAALHTGLRLRLSHLLLIMIANSGHDSQFRTWFAWMGELMAISRFIKSMDRQTNAITERYF